MDAFGVNVYVSVMILSKLKTTFPNFPKWAFAFYTRFNAVILLAQMPMVERLCSRAEVEGASKPKKPAASSDVLKATIKR